MAGVCSKEPVLHPDSGLGPLSFAGCCSSDDSDKWKSQASRCSHKRILCALLLLLLPLTALVTLVAPLCFLPRDPTNTSGAIVPHPTTQPHALASSLFTLDQEYRVTLMDLRWTSLARESPPCRRGTGRIVRGCSFNTDLPSSTTNLGAVQSRPRRRGRAATKEKLYTQGKARHSRKS